MAEKAAASAAARKPEAAGVNVQVLLRCRPLSQQEVAGRVPQVVRCHEHNAEVTVAQGKTSKSFHFDKVFDQDCTQSRLYAKAIKPIVSEVLEGFNCTIFAYGQTGTGKTFTMEGGGRDSTNGSQLSEAAGVIPRAINQIFKQLENTDYTVKCSFLELYNEEITDLLAVGESQPKLNILQDGQDKGQGVVVKGLEELIVRDAPDIYSLLDRGCAKRRTAATLLNEQSSRSHSVFCITAHMREVTPDSEEVIKIGKLYLVDLAGSEAIGRSGATDARAKEAGSINKSLLTLGRVIKALVTPGEMHVPYRDSKLTRLLKDSLGGRNRTCIIATIAPTVHCLEETLSTLDYAHKAKDIRNKPQVNLKVSKAAHIKEMNAEIDRLTNELYAQREKNGVYLPLKRFEELTAADKRLPELEAQMAEARERAAEEAAQLQEQLSQRAQKVASLEQELSSTQVALAQARQGMQQRDYLISVHAQSEANLVKHADALRTELARTATELGATFAKIAEKTALEGSNAMCVRELQGLVSTKLQALGTTVARAMAAQQGHFATITQLLAQHAANKQSAMDTLQQQAQQLQAQIAAVPAGVAAALDKVSAATAASHKDMRQLHDDHIAAAQAAAASASEELSSAHTELCSGLSDQTQRLTAFAAQLTEDADAAAAAFQEAITAGSRGLQEAAALAMAWREDATAQASDQQTAIAAFTTEFDGSVAQGQKDLLEKMRDMVKQFADGLRQKTSAKLEGLRQQVAAGDVATGKHAANLQRATGACVQQLQACDGARGAAEIEAAQARQAAQQQMADGIDSSRSSGGRLESQATAALDMQLEQQQSLRTRLHASLAASRPQIDRAIEDGTAAAQTAAEALQFGQESTLATVQDSWREDHSCARRLGAANTTASELASGMVDQHTSSVAALSDSVTGLIDTKYRDGIPTDDLPQQRTVPVPPEGEAKKRCTPPADVVLAEFNSKLQQSGADADGKRCSLSSEDSAEVAAATRTSTKRAAPADVRGAVRPLQMLDPNQQLSQQPHDADAHAVKRRRTAHVASQ